MTIFGCNCWQEQRKYLRILRVVIEEAIKARSHFKNSWIHNAHYADAEKIFLYLSFIVFDKIFTILRNNLNPTSVYQKYEHNISLIYKAPLYLH